MSTIGELERETQNRVVKLFKEKLKYRYLGNWEEEERSRPIESNLLSDYLKSGGYNQSTIRKALFAIDKVIGNQVDSLYDINKSFYSMLRYGVGVKEEAGENTQDVYLINWKEPLKNDFAIAEEVSVKGERKKRPDIVLYVNGIALGVIELKRSTVSISQGIRQNLDNQKHLFIKSFFTTMQLIMAGSDSEGLKYGTIETSERFYLTWKEVSEKQNPKDKHLLELTKPIRDLAATTSHILDKHIVELLNKERLIEILHDFIVFDRGIKKLCRPNQYFGVKASQEHIRTREGGIIWHTQGSGKSLTMVWLTKWIREFNPNARVLIVTDRDELDKQIEKVFKGINEDIYRTKSGEDLVVKLNETNPWLLCSLIHKFGNKDETDYDSYLEELKNNLPRDFKAKGEFYVFVDECHRTQSGKLHDGMKTLLPNALIIGFTGTPLLKKDKKKSIDTFGSYIHTYKFDEAVNDKVVLDLRYEARDIEQKISSKDKIDQWFEAKTKGLTEFARTELKQKWGTIKKVFSSVGRLNKIVADILLDMAEKERLQNGRGNAILVSDSIYNACRFYELFQQAGFTQCAIVTSFIPNENTIKGEETGEGVTEKLRQYEIYTKMLNGKTTEKFEDEAKAKFVDEPAQMKLLIVVDKLLTGFDAPSASYLYIDKSMKDHGLFQAICRVNRIDGDDKEYGYIIDYKDLFKKLEKSVDDYTSEALVGYEKEDVEGLLSDRLIKGKERLDDALETIRALCEPVEPPKSDNEYRRYFCGNTEMPQELIETEPRRIALYKAVISLIRAYANIAGEIDQTEFTAQEAEEIRLEIKGYENLRKIVQLASGDHIDLKHYEPAMRHLIDSYIGAEESKIISAFDDFSLLELIVERGQGAFDKVPEDMRKNKEAMAETIENNLRKVIIEESPTNPAYYEKMSTVLDELIKLRNQGAKEYEEYLIKIVELTRKVVKIKKPEGYPYSLNTGAKRALYDNLNKNKELALALDKTVLEIKDDDWRGTYIKRRKVRIAVKKVLNHYEIRDEEDIDMVFNLISEQIIDY